MKAHLVYCGSGWFDVIDAIERALVVRGVEGTVVRLDRSIAIEPQLRHADVILPSNFPVGAAEIAAAPHLRLIQQPAAGFERIELAAARARGVPVCNAPGANVDAVAEATLFMLLALARRAPAAARAFHGASIGAPCGVELRDRTLGVIGLGRIGSRVAELARGLGMHVASIRRGDGREALLALLARADAVTLHCPLDAATRGMLDDEAFAAMKRGAFLLNLSRGGIVDRAALVRALDHGHLGGVALDVFWEEPWEPSDPLFARDRVVVLPHVAGSTEEAFSRIGDVVAANVAAVLAGAPLVHRLDV